MFNFNQWDSRHRFDGRRFSELLSSNQIDFLLKNKTNGKQYNRRAYNQMDGKQQDKFDEQFYKEKTNYGFHTIFMSDTSWYEIPKNVFEFVKGKFPIIEHDFYVKKVN